jgi:succinate-semialdehyde dehydrogenase/glutarate-semialdehyde dehydrogenase
MSIATDEQQVVERVQNKLYIGGEWRDASGGGTISVVDPATEEALCEVADGTPEDAMAALDAAVETQQEWGSSAPNDRAGVLWKAFELLMERADELATLMTLEMGKPVAESKAEIVYAADFFRWFSGEALRLDGNYKQFANGTSRVLVMKQPVGPTLMITPWNFPMAMGTRKLGPAIAAGCTSVVKPAQQTPLSMLALAQVLEEAGLPGGVVNILTTSSSGKTTGPLIEDGRLRKLSFTGSTEVGRSLIEASAKNVLNVSMELGGNAPFLIFDDADLDEAVEGALLAKMRNIGEACTSANRFHVAEPVREEFTKRLADKMGSLKIGRGTEDDVKVGPLIDEPSREKVMDLVEDALSKGATKVVGGEIPDGSGYFVEPTVLRSGGPRGRLRLRGGGDRARQRHRVRPGRVRLHPRHQARAARLRGPRDRHGRPEPGHGLERRRPLRRREAERDRARGRPRGPGGVPRDEVRGRQPLTELRDESVVLSPLGPVGRATPRLRRWPSVGTKAEAEGRGVPLSRERSTAGRPSAGGASGGGDSRERACSRSGRERRHPSLSGVRAGSRARLAHPAG